MRRHRLHQGALDAGRGGAAPQDPPDGIGMEALRANHAGVGDAPEYGPADGVYEPEILIGGSFPAAEGWYATIAAPHLLNDPKSANWVKRYAGRYDKQPNDYCITSCDAVLVIADAIARCRVRGSDDRGAMRDAIEATRLATLQGTISFDKNGDLTSRVISVFQIRRDTAFPPEDMAHQFKYIGLAPQDTTS
jgi:branched-chain amino acid transport system substrate-binding protein